MIYIDFQGGAHGNFLEFVCNKFLAGVETEPTAPFNDAGASHCKKYVNDDVPFKAWHYFDYLGKRTIPDTGNIISIQISDVDLLPLSAISLLRAGDFGYDNNELEQQTFDKLNNQYYQSSLQVLADSFFANQVKDSYSAVRDPSWPEVHTIEDFKNLPQWIQDECTNLHNLYLLDFTDNNCPRWVLREFFKIGFRDTTQNGFIRAQEDKMYYNPGNDVFKFPFGCFYDTDEFTVQVTKLANWLGIKFEPSSAFVELHQQFLAKQPYLNIKKEADQLVEQIIDGMTGPLPEVDLIVESYVSAKLELHYNKELPSGPDSWFTTLEGIRGQFE